MAWVKMRRKEREGGNRVKKKLELSWGEEGI